MMKATWQAGSPTMTTTRATVNGLLAVWTLQELRERCSPGKWHDAPRYCALAVITARDLGHPDWETREEASKQLESLGYLAKMQLNDTRKNSTDPEVQRRVRVLLEGIKE